MRSTSTRVVAALAMTTLMLTASAALADDIHNTIDATIDVDAEILPLTVGTDGSATFQVQPRNSDGKQGCNLTGSTHLSVSVESSDTSKATVSPTSLTFSSCGDQRLVTVTPLAPGDSTISLTEIDNSTGASFDLAPATFIARVSAATATNRAPTVATAAVDATGDEGSALAASGAFTDPDGDALTVTRTAGDGALTDNGDGTWDWSLTPTDDGSGTVTLRATDPDGLYAEDTFDWTADNVAPTVATPVLTRTGACDVSLSAGFTDPGSADTHAASIDWGDGSGDGPAAATTPVTGSHSYAASGTHTVDVTVTDDDGGSDTASRSFSAHNTPSGVLAPINATGTSTFKISSTVPVKITVTGCDGTEVTDLAPSVGLARVDLDPAGTVNEVVSTSAADSGTAMRWADTHYQFNLSTKRSQFNTGQDLVSGGYRLTISDGSFATPVVAHFDLRR